LFLRPIFKPFQQLLESPVAEKIVYAITEWRFDFLLQKHRVKANAGPEVSIIIPIYNVASYLSVCVKSALLQTHNNVRIVLVEDGSSDNSPEIAKSFADHYENVQLITQKNAGLAAARNTGVEAIKKTDYLLFLDSDDVIPLKAVENYLNAIGSLNLAVGKPTRLKGFALYKRSREIFNKPVVETTLTSRVDFLSDVTAWNKLIRFDFWKAAGYRFPVGFLYEDMALMTRIYAESGGFAAVTKTSYFWRSRVVGGTSITQERWQMTNLEHRLKAIEDTLVVLEELYPRSAKSKDLWDYYQWSTARFDINFFMPWVEHTEQVYFDTLHKTAKRLYADADSLFWKKVPERYRAALKALIAQDRQAVISAIVQARLNVAKPSK
jgi:glycosyltransferase involved in cell wall biosynthesis